MKSAAEKREKVFERILFTGRHPIYYLTGKGAAAFIMAMLQLSALLLLTHFIFDLFPRRSLHFWWGMGLITMMFCLSIGAITILFTSLIFHIKEAAANSLFTLILGLIGTIGGSFVPIYILPDDSSISRAMDVREGRADVAVRLMENNYQLIATVDSLNVGLVDRYIHSVFEKEFQFRAATEHSNNPSQLLDEVKRNLMQAAVTMKALTMGGGNMIRYDRGFHLMIGFTLFLVIFTIGFKLNAILQEKTSGIWNRCFSLRWAKLRSISDIYFIAS